MRNALFGLTIFAVFMGGPCQAGQTGHPSFHFTQNESWASMVITIISPELPEPEDQDLEEDPDSLPPVSLK